MQFRFCALALAVAVLPLLHAEKIPRPDRNTAAPTAAQTLLIREGVALHDQHDFARAIAKYKQALAENPWEVTALHELSFTYFESGNYKDALATARLGARCRSQLLPRFYILIGNALDEMGRGNEAIEVYKAAVKQDPGVGLLYYNLAISLRRAGKQVEAKAAVEKALELDPSHSSSHVFLGGIYRDMGYRVPAILAFSRFLVLEPESARAAKILPVLQALLSGGAKREKEPGHIAILMTTPRKSQVDEGDFAPVELMFSILAAGDLMKADQSQDKASSSYDRVVSIYSSLGSAIENAKPGGGFAASYYAPYFSALAKAGHAEALVGRAWSRGEVAGRSEWVKVNGDKLEAFRNWSETYQWAGR